MSCAVYKEHTMTKKVRQFKKHDQFGPELK